MMTTDDSALDLIWSEKYTILGAAVFAGTMMYFSINYLLESVHNRRIDLLQEVAAIESNLKVDLSAANSDGDLSSVEVNYLMNKYNLSDVGI